jgi:hypothetical protein
MASELKRGGVELKEKLIMAKSHQVRECQAFYFENMIP